VRQRSSSPFQFPLFRYIDAVDPRVGPQIPPELTRCNNAGQTEPHCSETTQSIASSKSAENVSSFKTGGHRLEQRRKQSKHGLISVPSGHTLNSAMESQAATAGDGNFIPTSKKSIQCVRLCPFSAKIRATQSSPARHLGQTSWSRNASSRPTSPRKADFHEATWIPPRARQLATVVKFNPRRELRTVSILAIRQGCHFEIWWRQ